MEALLEDIIDNDGSISSFFEYCDEEASQAVDSDSDGITDYYTFNLGASSNPLDPDFIPIAFCDQIRVDADTCKYDCNPETRDFEAFVIDVVSESIQAAYDDGIITDLERTLLNSSREQIGLTKVEADLIEADFLERLAPHHAP